MQYALLIQLCFSISQQCLPSMEIKPYYSSHYQCGIAGYQMSIKMLQGLGYAKTNSMRAMVRFHCKPLYET